MLIPVGAHKMQRMTSALTFLERYQQNGNEFLNNIFQVTGEDTWVSSLDVETKEQSKQWMRTYSPEKLKKFKQMLSACQRVDGNYFLGQERSADCGIHATRGHNNVRSVL
jgi:hypothetical protein